MKERTVVWAAMLAATFAVPAEAGCKADISDYVGWEIMYSGTVTGYMDENGRKEDGFKGCEYGRILIVDYTMKVTCAEYSYACAFHPDIVVLSDGISLKACIDDEMHDVRR